MKNIRTISCLLVVAAFAAGCSSTFEGAGRDIENAGKKIQKTF